MPADIALYAIGLPFTATGTVATTSGTGNVVGTGTLFLSEVAQNDIAIIAGLPYTVLSVADNTHMGVSRVVPSTLSGQVLGVYNLHTTIMQHGVPAPKGIFTNYSQPLDLGDGSLRGGGWPTAEWQWKYLTRAQRDILRELTSPSAAASSSQVYMKTLQNESTDLFAVYLGQCMWPQAEPKDATRRVPFTLRFRALVRVS